MRAYLFRPTTRQTVADNSNALEVAEIMRRVIYNYHDSEAARLLTNDTIVLMYSGYSLPVALAIVAYKAGYFDPDEPELQTIRTPEAVLKDRLANCVDYTVLIACIASNLVDPNNIAIEILDLNGNGYSHVRPLVNGEIIDVVPCQKQDGTEKLIRVSKCLPNLQDVGYKRNRIFPLYVPTENRIYPQWKYKF